MSAIQDVLRPYWLSGLADVEGTTTTPLKAWITDCKFVFDCHDNITRTSTFIATRDGTLLRALAHDIGRMSSAAFESMYGVTGGREIPRSTAWTLIRAYYSAFYAAHALLRVFGEAVVQFDREQTKALRSAIQISGGTTSVDDGLHLLSINPAASTFKIRKLTKGSHEDTWNCFGVLLNRLYELAMAPSPFVDRRSAQETATFLMELGDLLKEGRHRENSNWLSSVRNEINYQHAHGTWFPHTRANKFRAQVSENLEKWKAPPAINLPPQAPHLAKFAAAIAAILSFSKETTEELVSRNSANNSFIKHGALLVLRQSLG